MQNITITVNKQIIKNLLNLIANVINMLYYASGVVMQKQKLRQCSPSMISMVTANWMRLNCAKCRWISTDNRLKDSVNQEIYCYFVK